jgi:hypothetical protein
MFIRTGLIILLTAAAMMPASGEPFQHASGEWREYNRDWLAACPPVIDEGATDYYGFSCFASTGSQELNGANLPAYKLTVLRNRLTGDMDVSVVVAADNVETDQTRPLVFTFGGDAPVTLEFGTDLETRYNTINQFYVVDEAVKADLLERLVARNAVTLTVPLSGAATERQVWLSLRGLSASIDFMSTYARRVAQY